MSIRKLINRVLGLANDPPAVEDTEVVSVTCPEGVSPSLWDTLKAEHFRIWRESDIWLIAGQIKAESAWKPYVARKEPNGRISYGLMQVLDSTYSDLVFRYNTLLVVGSTNLLVPKYGVRAGILYDKEMWDACDFAYGERERYAFMLSAYNGGLGNLVKDRNLTAKAGADPTKWFNNVELHSGRGEKSFEINRRYVRTVFKYAEEYRNANADAQKQERPETVQS